MRFVGKKEEVLYEDFEVLNTSTLEPFCTCSVFGLREIF